MYRKKGRQTLYGVLFKEMNQGSQYNARLNGRCMRKLLIASILCFPIMAHAQDIKCQKGYQPYANRCVSQRMADYISCVEASGGNHDVMLQEITELGGQKASSNIKGSGSGGIAKGSGQLSLDRASERALAKRWETRWFPGGMSECSKVLDKPTRKELKKAIKDAIRESAPQTSGVLLPGNKPTPNELPCVASLPAGEVILFYGNSASYGNGYPHTVIQVDNQPLLVVGMSKGGVTVSAKLFSSDNRIVSELKDNKFFINPNNYFRIERPNKHLLIIYDQQGNQALNVEYLNRFAIKILGRFNLPNSAPIILSEDGTTKGPFIFSHLCSKHGNSVNNADIAF